MGALPSSMKTGPSVNEGNIYTISLQTLAASIATGDLMTALTPGHNFQIVDIIAVTNVAVTTGAKAATLTPYVGATACTGGVLTLSGTYAAGKVIASTATTALNIGGNADTITLTWSSVTTFIEGSFNIQLRIKNLDVLL